jgi:murein DD-endopeptidase MepM/ murein hydrolase activator NlpD
MRWVSLQRLRVLLGLPAYAARQVPWLWNYDFRDIRLILERDGNVHYFHLTPKVQRLVARGSMSAAGAVCSVVLLLALNTVRVSLRASELEQAQRETFAALSAAEGVPVGNQMQAKTLAERIQNRQAALLRLLETSVSALKAENAQLWGGLQKAGLNSTRFDSVSKSLPAGGPAATPSFEKAGVDVESDAIVDEVVRNREIKEVLRALPGQMPLVDAEISSDYGLRRHPILGKVDEHKGLDLYSRTNKDTVRTVRAGHVRVARYSGDYGNMVVVTHAGGVETLYGHLSKITVKEGQQIEQQAPIGVVGSTGMSTGKHLHFEVLVGGATLDPEMVIRAAKNVQQ